MFPFKHRQRQRSERGMFKEMKRKSRQNRRSRGKCADKGRVGNKRRQSADRVECAVEKQTV